MISITLPFPPTVNSLYGGGSNQQRFPSKQYKAWLIACPPLTPHKVDKCEIIYRYYFPDKRERDTENYVKAVSDYLVKQQVLLGDSWQHVLDMRITPMGIDKENPRVHISIIPQ